MVARRPSLSYQGIIALLAGLMVMTVLHSLSDFWRMSPGNLLLTLMAVTTVSFAWLCWRSPWAGLLVGSTLLIAAVVALQYFPTWAAFMSRTGVEAAAFLTNVKAFEFDTTFGVNLGHFFLALAGFGLGTLVVMEALTEGTSFWSLTLGGLVFAIQWLFYYDQSVSAFMLYAGLGFSLWIIAQAARRDVAWANSGRRVGYRSHVVTPLAWVLLLSIVAALLPSDFSAINLGKLGERLQQAIPALRQMRGGTGSLANRFSLRSTGFSPTMGLLGGPVRPDNSVALHLVTEGSLASTAYLRGATFTTYTGSTWTTPNPQYMAIGADGVIPTALAADVLREYVKLWVTPQVTLGATLFTLLEPHVVQDVKVGYRVDTDFNITAERSVTKGLTYLVTARTPRFSAAQIRLLSTGLTDGLPEYRALPPALPRRVGEMAQSITRGQIHPFDKALAIEAYLRGMRYALNVPSPPAGRDFVDYFLFDLQRGYCTYYATAMAVMLRELGIPTRMIEGFAIPPSEESIQTEDYRQLYAVRNSQAHAWVEAYFPGYGWVNFDPTPRSDLPLIDRSVPAPDPSGLSDFDDRGDEFPDDLGDDPLLDGGLDVPDEGSTDFGGGTTGRDWPWALTALLSLAGGALFLYRRMRLQDRLTATEGRAVVQEAWERTGSLFGRFNFGRKPHQTASEYANALSENWPTLREPIHEVAGDYTLARFGPPGRPLAAEAPSRARQLWTRIHVAIQSRYGWRRYIWNRLKWWQ